MFEYLVKNWMAAAVSVVSILILLQTVKKLVEQQLQKAAQKTYKKPAEVPGPVWWTLAWALGVGSAFLSPLGCEEWRCWVNAALIHGALALALYPMSKRIIGKVQDVFVGAK